MGGGGFFSIESLLKNVFQTCIICEAHMDITLFFSLQIAPKDKSCRDHVAMKKLGTPFT